MNDRTAQAERRGMVMIDHFNKKATIIAPPEPDQLTDADWLLLLRAASEILTDLEQSGYTVSG